MKKSRRTSTSILNPVTLAVAGIALLVIAIAFVLYDSGDSEPNASSNNPSSNIPYPEVPRVSLTEAKAHYDADTAIFVDVRSVQEYETAHIPGALALPLAELQTNHQELPADALIFLYCT